MNRSFIISAVLHLVVIFLMLFGSPFRDEEAYQQPVAVEFIALPLKTAEEQGGEKLPQSPSAGAEKPPTAKGKPAKEEVVEEIKPAKPETKKNAIPEKAEGKSSKIIEDPNGEKITMDKARDSIAEMLKGLKPSKPAASSSSLPKMTPGDLLAARNGRTVSVTSGNAASGGSIMGTGQGGSGGLNEGEMNSLRSQLTSCWNFPVGAKRPEELVVDVKVEMNPDRTVKSTEVVFVNTSRMDNFYRSAAEAARRAVLKCQPLQVPNDRYELWSTIVIRFDPKELL